jgi:hypothetical protein
MNMTTYLIGDFRASQIFAEVPQEDGKSKYRKLDPASFDDKKEVIAHNAQGAQRRFIFCSLSRGFKQSDADGSEIAVFQPSDPVGKRFVLNATENFKFVEVGPTEPT